MRIFFTILSYVFQPLLMMSFGLLIFLNSAHISVFFLSGVAKRTLVLTAFSVTFLLPALGLLLMKKAGYVNSLMLPERQERLLPLCLSFGCYLAFFVFVQRLPDVPAFSIAACFALSTLITLTACLVLTAYWKISLHAAGMGGICGFFALLSFELSALSLAVVCITFIFSGLVMTGRVYLQAHSPWQVFAGFLMGFIPQYPGFFVLHSLL